jgi:tetrahydromethanopterin S-methyltransferase subunit B
MCETACNCDPLYTIRQSQINGIFTNGFLYGMMAGASVAVFAILLGMRATMGV